jgi:hypothetical protein
MEMTLRKFNSHEEMRAETYRYWHSRPDWEIFEETSNMSEAAWLEWYRMKGIVHAERSTRSFTRIERRFHTVPNRPSTPSS